MSSYSIQNYINDIRSVVREEIEEKKIIDRIVKPTLKALRKKNKPYKGFLYVGLMIKNKNPYLIEFNVRMGDPECQTILPKLETDLAEIIIACCNKKLDEIKIEWSEKKSLCIVLCSNGYPDEFKKNVIINNLDKISLDKNEYLLHAGTIKKNDTIEAVGGRVLNFVSVSEDFKNAKQSIFKNLDKLIVKLLILI